MMNASFKGHYNTDKSGAVGTFVVNGGDVRLKTSITEATFANGLSLSGLGLSVEKPGSFIIDYNIPKQITASLNLAEELKIPKLSAESTWNVEL